MFIPNKIVCVNKQRHNIAVKYLSLAFRCLLSLPTENLWGACCANWLFFCQRFSNCLLNGFMWNYKSFCAVLVSSSLQALASHHLSLTDISSTGAFIISPLISLLWTILSAAATFNNTKCSKDGDLVKITFRQIASHFAQQYFSSTDVITTGLVMALKQYWKGIHSTLTHLRSLSVCYDLKMNTIKQCTNMLEQSGFDWPSASQRGAAICWQGRPVFPTPISATNTAGGGAAKTAWKPRGNHVNKATRCELATNLLCAKKTMMTTKDSIQSQTLMKGTPCS